MIPGSSGQMRLGSLTWGSGCGRKVGWMLPLEGLTGEMTTRSDSGELAQRWATNKPNSQSALASCGILVILWKREKLETSVVLHLSSIVILMPAGLGSGMFSSWSSTSHTYSWREADPSICPLSHQKPSRGLPS